MQVILVQVFYSLFRRRSIRENPALTRKEAGQKVFKTITRHPISCSKSGYDAFYSPLECI